MIMSAMVFNGFMTTIFMDNCTTLDRVLNALTFGMYGFVMEARKCSRTGVKTETLFFFKLLEGCESLTSLLVASYSLVISGYLDGYEGLTGFTLVTRWGSVATSLVTLPLLCRDYVHARNRKGDYSWNPQFAKALQGSGILLFHVGECWSMMVLLLFQAFTRPYGIFWILGAQWAAVACSMILSEGPKGLLIAFLLGPIFLAFNVFGTQDVALACKVAVAARLAGLAVALGVIASEWAEHERLASQLLTPSCAPLLVVAAAGTVLYPAMAWEQYRAGRWTKKSVWTDYEALQQIELGEPLAGGRA